MFINRVHLGLILIWMLVIVEDFGFQSNNWVFNKVIDSNFAKYDFNLATPITYIARLLIFADLLLVTENKRMRLA